MKNNEILSIKSDDTALVIVQDDLFIGEPGHDSDKRDIVISWQNDTLHIHSYTLTEAMVKVLKMYINKEL